MGHPEGRISRLRRRRQGTIEPIPKEKENHDSGKKTISHSIFFYFSLLRGFNEYFALYRRDICLNDRLLLLSFPLSLFRVSFSFSSGKRLRQRAAVRQMIKLQDEPRGN